MAFHTDQPTEEVGEPQADGGRRNNRDAERDGGAGEADEAHQIEMPVDQPKRGVGRAGTAGRHEDAQCDADCAAEEAEEVEPRRQVEPLQEAVPDCAHQAEEERRHSEKHCCAAHYHDGAHSNRHTHEHRGRTGCL